MVVGPVCDPESDVNIRAWRHTLVIDEAIAEPTPPKTLRAAVVDPFRDFVGRAGLAPALLVLAFLFLYKLGDNMATALQSPFFIDVGFTLTQIGAIAKTAGLIAAIVGGLILGVVLALMRMSPLRPISALAQAYIWLFRGTPLLVQLLIIYTGLPLAIGVRFSVLEAALLCLILNEAAHLADPRSYQGAEDHKIKGGHDHGWQDRLYPDACESQHFLHDDGLERCVLLAWCHLYSVPRSALLLHESHEELFEAVGLVAHAEHLNASIG